MNLDAIRDRNEKIINGVRKSGLLVNEGDKLTREEILVKKEENKARYGLTQEQVAKIILPMRTEVKIYDIKQILGPKNDFSTIEKITHL